jgi:hypothetical protein
MRKAIAAAVVAIAALGVAPAGAAQPHWYVNGAKMVEPTTVVSWGSKTIKAEARFSSGIEGELTCRYVNAGVIRNDPERSMFVVGASASYDCEQVGGGTNQCKGWVSMELPEPWLGYELGQLAGGKPYAEALRPSHTLERCHTPREREPTWEARNRESFGVPLRPVWHNGTSALHPSFLEWSGAATGELEAVGTPGEPLAVATVEGEEKVQEYNEQGLVTVKAS